MSMLAELVEVVIGVDTHSQTHTAAVLDARTGAVLARATVTADPDGYAELVALAEQHSGLRAWALEGTGGYGAGLARHLADSDELVVELDRPKRPARRAGAKSDPIDAERAARDALARTQLAQPKTGAERAALQMLLTARRAAVEAATAAQRQLLAMVITAPEPVRARFRGQSTRAMITTAAALRPGASSGNVEIVTALTVLRDLARRIRFLEAEALSHEQAIRAIVRSWRPDLLELTGVGPIVAATVLTAWSHPGRCRDDAAFAMLAGTAPIPASSGKTVRYRLNRSGDRQLNRALHTVTLTRLQRDERTRAYADRRRTEGRTDREIRSCPPRARTSPTVMMRRRDPTTVRSLPCHPWSRTTMSSLSDLFDVYALRARLYPAFLCVLPVLGYVFVLLGKPDGVELWMPLVGSLGLLFFLANVVRSRGKKREATLVETWGGMPTTLLLRHRTPGNQPLRERRRRRLEAVIGEPLPTEANEQDSPAAADDRYVTAIRVLISRVRDAADKHPRVHEENINYGFRRNLLALKTPALVVLVLALGVDVAIGVLADQWIKAAVLGGIHLLTLTAWLVVVTSGWVRETADSYAERLFDTLEDPSLTAS